MKIVDRILAVLIGGMFVTLLLCILAVSCIENNKPVEEGTKTELVSPK